MNMEQPKVMVHTQNLKDARKSAKRRSYIVCNKNELKQLLKFTPKITNEEVPLDESVIIEVRDFSLKHGDINIFASRLKGGLIKIEMYRKAQPEMPQYIAAFYPNKYEFAYTISLSDFSKSDNIEDCHNCSREARKILQAILVTEKKEQAFEKRNKGNWYMREAFINNASRLVIIPSHTRVMSDGRKIHIKGYKYYRNK